MIVGRRRDAGYNRASPSFIQAKVVNKIMSPTMMPAISLHKWADCFPWAAYFVGCVAGILDQITTYARSLGTEVAEILFDLKEREVLRTQNSFSATTSHELRRIPAPTSFQTPKPSPARVGSDESLPLFITFGEPGTGRLPSRLFSGQ